MHLSDHSLSQLDEADVQALDAGRLRGLSWRLLEDLKEARERLRQNPDNSARPPSGRAPWERRSTKDADEADAADIDATTPVDDAEAPGAAGAEAPRPPEYPPGTTAADAPARAAVGSETSTPKRKAGKQPGAPGVGRTQVLKAQETLIHRPSVCAACAQTFAEDAPSVADAGFQSVDLVWADRGAASALSAVAPPEAGVSARLAGVDPQRGHPGWHPARGRGGDRPAGARIDRGDRGQRPAACR